MNTSLALFIVAIVAIVFGSRVLRDHLKVRRTEFERNDAAQEYQSRIDDLEERIRVLERIVTEKNYDLRREISDL